MTVEEHPQGPAPYVQPPVAVEVEQDGTWFPGWALAWWSDRVHVRFTVDVGMSHQQTVDAGRVRRRT